MASEAVQTADGETARDPSRGEIRQVITASSLGTVFEWYDFYLYGLVAAIIAAKFLTGLNATTSFIMALLVFAAGFVVRPFGALVFGRIGDLFGRRYTFIITLTVMGLSTFLVGCLPTYKTAGVAAPISAPAAAPTSRACAQPRRGCAGAPAAPAPAARSCSARALTTWPSTSPSPPPTAASRSRPSRTRRPGSRAARR